MSIRTMKWETEQKSAHEDTHIHTRAQFKWWIMCFYSFGFIMEIDGVVWENEGENAKPILFSFVFLLVGEPLSFSFVQWVHLNCRFLFSLCRIFFGHSLYAYDRAMRRDVCVCGYVWWVVGWWKEAFNGLHNQNLFDIWTYHAVL